MKILYFLESLRNPFLDAVMSFITRFGEEYAFLCIALIVFWCVDKFEGYYMMCSGFIATVFGQFLKITCRIPRPFVKDPNFTIVESARAAATGYSFPSGHTLNAVSTFGCAVRSKCPRFLRGVFIALMILVPFSRMYLGVHTLWDVLVGAVVSILLVFSLYPLFERARKDRKILQRTVAFLLLFVLAVTLYVSFFPFPEGTDKVLLSSAKENVYKLLGANLGILLTVFLDRKYLNFSTKAPLLGQILKVVFGMILTVGLKSALKPLLSIVLPWSWLCHILRYFLVVLFTGFVWPLTFRFFGKLQIKKDGKAAENE